MTSQQPITPPAKILLTGPPRCGKTTAVIDIIRSLNLQNAAGFYTEQILERNKRTGFRWVSLDGRSGTLAHINASKAYKVGKYGVNIAEFEKNVVPIIDVERTNAPLLVIDEIGKMECLSRLFVAAIERLFASERSVLATIAEKGPGIIKELKQRPDVRLFTLSRSNREKVVIEIKQLLTPMSAK